jgi:precorrin-6x reductase
MRIVIFSGTSDGRKLSGELLNMGAEVTVSVATEYGREELERVPGVSVRTGRLDADGMAELLRGADLCIDATHPYAADATRNIRSACEKAGVAYRRLKRETSSIPDGSIVADSADDAAKCLLNTEGNILITTGTKELESFAVLDRSRLYPRVLPAHDSLTACEKAGIPRRNVIAMQGPFSTNLNLALMEQFSIRWLVTKDGGVAGGFKEKAEAAEKCGVKLIVIRPPRDDGEDHDSILSYCRERML